MALFLTSCDSNMLSLNKVTKLLYHCTYLSHQRLLLPPLPLLLLATKLARPFVRLVNRTLKQMLRKVVGEEGRNIGVRFYHLFLLHTGK